MVSKLHPPFSVIPDPSQSFSLPWIAFCVIFWMLCNFYLNFTNKYLFQTLHFDYPVLIVFAGTTLSFFGSGVMMLVEIRRGGKLGWSVVKENFLLMILLGAGHSLTSGFENLALKRVSLSLTQMVKSSGPAVVMLFHWTRTGKSYTAKMKAILILQILGASLAVYHNPEYDFIGIIFCLLSMFSALTAVIVSEKMMQRPNHSLSPVQLTFFSSIPALFVLVTLMEGDELSRLRGLQDVDRFSLALVLSTAVVALFYTCSQYMVVQCTSALYSQVISNFRTALLVVLAIYIFDEKLPLLNVIGVAWGIIGFVAYSIESFCNGGEEQKEVGEGKRET